jgi:iron complex transport system ATP-binding protein
VRLATEALVVRYPSGARLALDGVTMRAREGQLTAVLGPNGSGKSTLVKAILGTVPVLSGRTLIDSEETSSWSRRALARSVGVVPQAETIAFPMTARQMVAMGRYPYLGAWSSERDADRRAVAAAMGACDVTDLADRDITTLSGGELQRVRIARALAQEPKALVLDEPTASLDIRHEMAILELLRTSADQGMTVVLVTHGLDLAARFADELLLLADGRVAASGSPETVLRADVLERVYRWPISVSRDPSSGTPHITPERADARNRPASAASP